MKTLHLYGDVDEDMYKVCVEFLSNGVPKNVLLHTQGGDFYIGLSIYDLLKKHSPTIIATGACMSAGVLIFCAGEKRLATPSTQFMIHYGQDSNASSSEAAHNKDMLKLMKDIVASRTNVTRRTINWWFKADTFINVKRAKQIRLVNG